MSDLRTGLVEAIARVLIDDPHCDDATNQKVWDELAFTVKGGTYEKAEAIVDRMLGFLTDNAEAWSENLHGWSPLDVPDWRTRHINSLIAAIAGDSH